MHKVLKVQYQMLPVYLLVGAGNVLEQEYFKGGGGWWVEGLTLLSKRASQLYARILKIVIVKIC